MTLKLVSHVNDDGDLLEAWFKHYLGLGVTSFHLIVHGSRADNTRLFNLKESYPVVIEDSYEGEFRAEEKKRRLNSLLASLTGQWLVLADSDEFVEFPYRRIPMTIRMLEWARANVLFAPMLQHLMADGSLASPEIVKEPFRTFPLCSVDLYEKMGTTASTKKYPLFYCGAGTMLADGGNHNPPIGMLATLCSLLGVTHHFKFRKAVLQRLDNRIHSSHTWRHESIQFRQYLDSNGNRLPIEDAFAYSRAELFRRKLLRRYSVGTGVRLARRIVGVK